MMNIVFNNIHSLLNQNIDSIFALLDVFKLLQSLVYMSCNKNMSCQNIRETEQQNMKSLHIANQKLLLTHYNDLIFH